MAAPPKTLPRGPATQRLQYLASHLDTAKRSIEDWKLRISETEARIAPAR